MQILDRVVSNAHICGVEIAFNGVSVPSVITGWQPFYNSLFTAADFEKIHPSLASIDFSEESNTSAAGTSFKQKISFRFPNSDSSRADRIALFHKIKFVKIILTNGRNIVVGRNDFNQNTNPVIKSKLNHKLCEIEVESQSIFASGYTPSFDRFGLPVLIPLSF